MVCGGIDDMLTDIARPESPKLDEFMKALPDAERIPMASFNSRLYQKLSLRLGLKFQYVKDAPMMFLGAVGHTAGVWPIEESRAAVRRGLAMRDDAVSKGQGANLDSVTLRFSVDDEQPWKADFEQFCF